MLYLSGLYKPELAGAHPKLGFLLTRAMSRRLPPGVAWAADTMCYTRPQKFSVSAYVDWLRIREHREQCRFVTVPDKVGDCHETLALWSKTADAIAEAGLPLAFVAQDGQDVDAVPWSECDALFIGGTTEFKLSERAYRLLAEAKARGKWTHVGRVNSARRYAAFHAAGVDSADGTFLCWGPTTNMRRLLGWLNDSAPALFAV